MKVVVAVDSLKNSLTSYEAGKAIEAGIRNAYSDTEVEVIVKPLADGGEGTVAALVEGLHGELRYAAVHEYFFYWRKWWVRFWTAYRGSCD